MVVDADGFPAADFFADFPANHVCFALVHAKLADFDFHMENVCDLHGCVEVVGDVVGFAFFSACDFQGACGSG